MVCVEEQIQCQVLRPSARESRSMQRKLLETDGVIPSLHHYL